MTEKIKPGYTLPKPLIDAFAALTEKLGGKSHWALASVGVLLLFELSEKEQLYYRRQVVSADEGGDYRELLAKARGGKMRDEAGKEPAIADGADLVHFNRKTAERERSPKAEESGAGTRKP